MGTLQYAGVHLQHAALRRDRARGLRRRVGGAGSEGDGAAHPARIALLLENILSGARSTSTGRCRRTSSSTPPSKPTCAGRCSKCSRRRKRSQRAKQGVMKLVGAVYGSRGGHVRFAFLILILIPDP